jgi:hypothetical protein
VEHAAGPILEAGSSSLWFSLSKLRTKVLGWEPFPVSERTRARAAGMSTFKAHVKTVDMSEEMEADAISIATEAIMTCSVEKDMAAYVCRRSASLVALRCSC